MVGTLYAACAVKYENSSMFDKLQNPGKWVEVRISWLWNGYIFEKKNCQIYFTIVGKMNASILTKLQAF